MFTGSNKTYDLRFILLGLVGVTCLNRKSQIVAKSIFLLPKPYGITRWDCPISLLLTSTVIVLVDELSIDAIESVSPVMLELSLIIRFFDWSQSLYDKHFFSECALGP